MSHSTAKTMHAYKVTDQIEKTIRGPVADDPVAKQYIPQAAEEIITPEERSDPIGDDAHSPVKGIVHRYPDRVLLKAANVCAVYCRYCFRKDMIGPGSDAMHTDDLEAALNYIRTHPEIWEVILTGGDPFILSPRRLAEIMDALEAIPHVKSIRVHTRVPVADPGRVTDDLCAALKRKKAVYVVVHINHKQEITADVEAAFDRLLDGRCVLLSQSVLLRGVNDNADTLEDLFRELAALRVKPYYLHHPDLVRGTGHFRLSIAEGQAIMKDLQGRLSGICLPTYMLDTPGGHGKVPLTPCFIESLEEGVYAVEDYRGQKHRYPPTGAS